MSHYHPLEAGRASKKWENCRFMGARDRVPGPGGKVRPGVACVHISRWPELKGRLLLIEGEGLYQVLDADVHRRRRTAPWFDLAEPGPPWVYSEWRWSTELARRARTYDMGTHGYILVPRDREEELLEWLTIQSQTSSPGMY